ncbi:Uncharacterized conserved protein YibQ, putative polysaccharide deacetylase 2 family [Roseivivax lentus]|uniref:Uncharacterized conserved protein YibQ, putative polysaccharide deacetylase 2 family n=1 Tax=Roseivivax lentus TaxID=633194 RepID=A0A1N7LWH2_9RHOB|nr:divergent polysaccharide deacetylase family protein [Roseivivax lentus]SIS78152.1 Uncharacterized conserved protein YibQ, putative polysaccharide deacetylase 2 family [Roseivivax lentus]
MARGLLAGAATGLAISVAAAAGLSLVMGYPPPPDGVLPEPAVSDSAVSEGTAPDSAADAGPAPSQETAPGAAGGVASLDAPASGDALPEDTDTTPAAVPDVAGESAALEAPETAGTDTAPGTPGLPGASGSSGIATAPVLGQPAPVSETGPEIATDPAQPPVPEMPQDEIALVAPVPEPAEAAPLLPRSDERAPDTGDRPGDMTAPGAAESAPDAGTESAPVPATEAEPQTESAEAPVVEDSAPELQDQTATEEAPEGPGIGTPALQLTDRADPARSTRLPTIGGDSGDETVADGAADGNAPEADAATDADAPPFRRYAASVEVAPDTPRMAVILIDDGSGPLGPAALDAFPFPVTFAVDPAAPDAAARMAGYREKGFEVLALVDLPDGAQPSDLEVTFEAALGTLPEVVGIMEAPGGAFQGSRDVTQQVADYLAASGHGLVMQGQGLNTATALARREGVPAGAVFRDIDAESEDPGMQRRLLDRVALRARQDGQVIALGRLKADTVSALLLWGLQDRAATLALVPVSAVIAQP